MAFHVELTHPLLITPDRQPSANGRLDLRLEPVKSEPMSALPIKKSV
jgi:hypothetical protein